MGLTAAIEYLNDIGMDRIRAHELALTNHALARLDEKLGRDCRIFGPPPGDDRGGVLSLAYRDVHAHDLAQVLDQFGVCVRPGHHCAKPLMRKLGRPGHRTGLVVPVQRRARHRGADRGIAGSR